MRAGDAVQLAGEGVADGGLLLTGAVLQHVDVVSRHPIANDAELACGPIGADTIVEPIDSHCR